MTIALQFIEAAAHPGLNVTVRKGPKWAKVPKGYLVPLESVDPDGATFPAGAALLLAAEHYGTLQEIPTEVLKFEHDQTCRDHAGLLAAMDRAYPQGHEGVDGYTVVFFWIS